MELDEAIWALHVPMLRLAASILRHPQNAEDAVSQAVITAYQKIDSLRNPAAFKAWMMKITARCCYDQLRRSKRELPSADPIPPETGLFAEPLQDTLYAKLQRLSPGQARVLTLYYYEGFSTEEIAKILGVPRTTVSMRMSRGRAKLKAMIEEEESEAMLNESSDV